LRLVCVAALVAAVAAVASAQESTLEARDLRGIPAIAAAHALGSSHGPLSVQTLAIPTHDPEEGVQVVIEVAGLSIVEQNLPAQAQLEVVIYLLDKDQGVAASQGRAALLDLDQLGEAIALSGLRYRGWLAVEPGAYRVRALARLLPGDAWGVGETAVTVTEAPARAEPSGHLQRPGGGVFGSSAVAAEVPLPVMAPPLLFASDTARPWIDVASSADPPLAFDDGRIPEALPVLVAGTDAQILLLDGKGGSTPVQWSDREGQVVGSGKVRAQTSRDGRGQEMSATVPEVEIGVYQLQVEDRSQRVVIVDPVTARRTARWTDVGRLAFTTTDGRLIVVDASSGETRWERIGAGETAIGRQLASSAMPGSPG